jgi:DNA-3-methyladenine glycosylase I
MGDGERGADGKVRCPWGLSDPLYVDYHDTEWGVPLRGTDHLFERMCLESFQSGLSWLIILRKRRAFRAAFAQFDPVKVAKYGEAKKLALMRDAGIVRNRAKIDAAVANARTVLDLDVDLTELLWSFAPTARPAPKGVADVPAITPESTAMAKELKRRGFRFLGPTTCYALMQATGMVDDHLADCWRSGKAAAKPGKRSGATSR